MLECRAELGRSSASAELQKISNFVMFCSSLMSPSALFVDLCFLYLNPQDALSKAQEVAHNLGFARELLKSFSSLNMEVRCSLSVLVCCVCFESLLVSDLPVFFFVFFFPCMQIQKAVKKTARREQLKREEAEQRRLKAMLEVQYVLDQLGEERVRQELRQVERGDDGPLLTEAELTGLDDFYKLVGPERDPNVR